MKLLKRLFENTNADSYPEIWEPEIVEKSWGREIRIWNKEYCGKILEFKADCKSSVHYHVEKDEVLYVLNGEFYVELYNGVDGSSEIIRLQEGQSLHLSVGIAHQIASTSGGRIIEFSTHHRDSDSRRIKL